MIKKSLYFFGLFGVLTNIYPLLAILFGLQFGVVTFLFLLLNLLILILNFEKFKILIRSKRTSNFLIIFLLIPFLLITITKESDIRFYFSNFYYISLILVSAILFQKEHRKTLEKTIFFALFFNLISTILSIISPEIFLIMAQEFDKSIYSAGRGFGLFLQPNMLGHSTILIFVICAMIFFEKKRRFTVALTLCMVTIFLSGSRSSILLFFFIISLHYILYLRKFKARKFSYAKYFLKTFCLAVLVFNFSDIKLSEIDFFNTFSERWDSFLNSSSKDPSQLEREYKRTAYYERIGLKTFQGYGIGSQFIDQSKGFLKGAAHNTHLEILYQGGILYYLSFIFFFFRLIYDSSKLKKFNNLIWQHSLILISTCILLSFVTSNLFQLRILYIAFGPLLLIPEAFNHRNND